MTDLATEYKKLVRAPATLQNLRRSIGLVQGIVSERFPVGIEWNAERLRGFWDSESHETETPAFIRRSIPSVESNTAEYGARRQLVKDVVVTLVLGSTDGQKEGPKDEDFSLLFDALLVLFHQSYFALLPTLESSGADRKALLQSYVYLSSRLSRYADVFRINGLVLLAAGDRASAKHHFRGAVLATHSDEHDFMTRLQTLWHMMLEDGAYQEALDLLIEVAPKVTRQDFDEFNDLIRDTFEAVQSLPRAR